MTQARLNGVRFYPSSPSVSGLVLELLTAKDRRKREDEQHKRRTTAITSMIVSHHYVPVVTDELQSGSETRQPT